MQASNGSQDDRILLNFAWQTVMLAIEHRKKTHPLEVHYIQAHMTDQLPYLLQAHPTDVSVVVQSDVIGTSWGPAGDQQLQHTK